MGNAWLKNFLLYRGIERQQRYSLAVNLRFYFVVNREISLNISPICSLPSEKPGEKPKVAFRFPELLRKHQSKQHIFILFAE